MLRTVTTTAKRKGLGERLFAICALLFASTAFVRLIANEEYGNLSEDALTSPVKRIVWPVVYITAGYLLFRYGKPALNTVEKMLSLLVLLACIALSVLWSGSRNISVLSAAALFGNTLTGFYFGFRYGVREFTRLLGLVFGVMVIATIVARVVMGDEALQDHAMWLGLFGQKNALGLNAGLGALVFFALAHTEKQKWVYRFFGVVCVALVLLAQAMTCVVTLVVLASGMICWSVIGGLRSNLSKIVLIGLAVTFSVAFISSHLDDIFIVLGKSPDLTGRAELWGVLAWMARDRPLLGYGYGGFWVFGGPAQTVWETLSRDPADAIHAHNGYLEMIVDCGIIGLGFLLWFLSNVFRKAWAYWMVTRNIWPLSLVLFLCLYNLGDTTFAARNNIAWLILVAVAVQLVRVSEESGTSLTRRQYPPSPEMSPVSA